MKIPDDLPPSGERLALYDALCQEVDPELWYPEKGGSTREAKAICRSCTDRQPCLEWALTRGERFGIWGGMSERERRKLTADLGIPTHPSGYSERGPRTITPEMRERMAENARRNNKARAGRARAEGQGDAA